MLPASFVGFFLLLGHFVIVSVGINSHVLKKRGYDQSGSYSSEEEPSYKRHGYGKSYGGKRHRYPPSYGRGHRRPSYDGFPYGDHPLFPPFPQFFVAPPMPFSPLQLPSVSQPQGDLGSLQIASPVLEGSPPKESPPLDTAQALDGAPAIQPPAAAPETNVVNSLAASPPLAAPQQLSSLWVGGRKKRSFNEPKTGKAKGRKAISETGPKDEQQGAKTTQALDTEGTTEKPKPKNAGAKKAEEEKPKQRTVERDEKEAANTKGEEDKEEEQVDNKKKQKEKQEKKQHRKEEEEEEEEEELGKKEQLNSEFTQGGPQFRSTWEER